jgi:hypothetical protein
MERWRFPAARTGPGILYCAVQKLFGRAAFVNERAQEIKTLKIQYIPYVFLVLSCPTAAVYSTQ